MPEITYWDRVRDLSELRSEIEQLIHRAAGGATPAARVPWRPVSNVVETKDSIVVTAELPGCKDEDVEVLLQDRMLTIRGTRKQEEKTEGQHFRRIERSYGAFARSFALPQGVSEKDIDANIAHGVLKVTIKLPESSEATRIPIAPGDEHQ